MIVDSSTISLFVDLFKGAERYPMISAMRGCLKIHAKLPLGGFVASLIHITETACNDKSFLGQLESEKGAIYVFDKGNATALSVLVSIFADGKDVPPNIKEALKYATEAAEKGSSNSMLFLGNSYLSGKQGVPKDNDQAVKWFTKAAESGNAEGMLSLGMLHKNGNELGLVTDHSSAFYWINQAGIHGSFSAMVALATIYQ